MARLRLRLQDRYWRRRRIGGGGGPPPDVTGPTLTGATYDPVSNTLGFTSSEAGTLFWLWDTSATPLAASVIEAGAQGSSPVDAGANLEPVSDDALAAGTWYLHWIVKDAAGNRTVGAVQTNIIYILDKVVGASAAFSGRKLRLAANLCLRVRRSSDNTQTDIGFTASGLLDTAALLAFVGSGSGFVVTWYDQSGNARHVSQSDATRQPRIVNAGVVDATNAVPAPFFDGTTDVLFNTSPFLYAAGAMTACVVCNNAPANPALFLFMEGSTASGNQTYRFITGGSGGNHRLSVTIRNDANVAALFEANLSDNAFNSVLKNIAIRDNGSSVQGFLNGTAGTAQNYTRSGVLTLDRFAIGRSDVFGFNMVSTGNVAEMIFFLSSLSNADLNAVNASQGAAYGITVNPI